MATKIFIVSFERDSKTRYSQQLGNLPPLCKNIAGEHKMQLAYYWRNTDWFQRCSEFGPFDEPFIICSQFFIDISKALI